MSVSVSANQNQCSIGSEDLETQQQTADSQDSQTNNTEQKTFFSKPFTKPLLLPNNESEARDMDAGERNYLAWLKISLYLSIAGAAIVFNLRLVDQAKPNNTQELIQVFRQSTFTSVSQQIRELDVYMKDTSETNHLFTYPLGIVFYSLSLLSVLTSFYNYVLTVKGYLERKMNVTSSILTTITIGLIALTILGSNIFVLWRLY